MKIITLAKKEAYDILTNKIYILVIFVQIFIILGAFGLAITSSIVTNPDLLDKWGVGSSLQVGISEDLQNSTLDQALKNENLNVIYLNDIEKANTQLGSRLMAVIEVSKPNEDILIKTDPGNAFYPVISQKITDAVYKAKLEKKLISSGLTENEIQKIENPIILTETKVNGEKEPELAINSAYFVEIMYGFIVPFILLLPFFLASNIVTDSIVGERERKTFEVLLMTPLSSPMVIIGKILPILSFSIIQSMAWILLLDLLKAPIYNTHLLLIILIFVGLGFTGIGILISMFVDSTKEANSAITLFLVFSTFIFFLPLFVKSTYFEGILNFIPTVLMVKISSTPNITPDILLFLIPTIIIPILIFTVAVQYFRHERAIRL